MNNYKNAALVLAGHGSTVNARSSLPVRQLVGEFQRRDCFARVTAGFWKEDPPLSTVLEDLSNERVFVIPFFVSKGYFTETVVPRELGFRKRDQTEFEQVQQCGNQTFFYCEPVGTHASMTQVIISCARSVVEKHPFPRQPPEREISLFIAGHGTGRNRESRKSVERQVEIIRQLGVYADVQAVFVEEEPQIQDCYKLATTRNIVMVPFFLSDGLHVCEDIPVLLGEPEHRVKERVANDQPAWRNPTEKHGRRVWYAAAVGTDPIVADVILERVGEAASWQAAPTG